LSRRGATTRRPGTGRRLDGEDDHERQRGGGREGER
jgi:hypothetical protein